MDNLIDGKPIPMPDLSYLKEMADGDETFVKEIMKESAESGDHEQLKFATHKLITQLTSVGILTAVPDVKRVNTGSKEMPDLIETVNRILKIADVSIEYLKTMI